MEKLSSVMMTQWCAGVQVFKYVQTACSLEGF